jgi:hypothetical protein
LLVLFVIFILFYLLLFYLDLDTHINDLFGNCYSLNSVNSPVNVSDINGLDIQQCYSSSENIACRLLFIFKKILRIFYLINSDLFHLLLLHQQMMI